MPQNNAAAKTPPPKDSGFIGETSAERGHVPLTEEFDRPKWTMPPLKPLLVALAIVALVVAGIVFFGRPKPGAAGSIDDIYAVETPDRGSVLVSVQFSIRNLSEKPFWVRSVSAHLETDQGKWDDPAASVADFERYFQAFPDLKQHANTRPWLKDTKIDVGGEQRGMVIVGFPVPKDAFDRRKAFNITVEAFDRRPLLIAK